MARALRNFAFCKAAFVLSFFLGSWSGPALAKQDEVLEPFTPWHVEWTVETCAMRRGFGSKDRPLILQIERFGPGDKFQLIVTGRDLRGASLANKLTIVYGETGYEHKVENPQYGTAKGGLNTIFVSTTALFARTPNDRMDTLLAREIEKTVDTIGLSWRKRQVLTLDTGALDKPLAALRKCTDDLLKHWKLDPV